MPTVSVVIPSYNRKELVVEALESVFSQTFRDYEIVLVDDGSTDGTEQAIRPFRDRLRYLYKPNGGVSSARNHGIRLAEGNLIAFLDSDDIWEANFLEITTGYLMQNPDVAMVSTGWRTLPGGHRWPPIRKPLLHGCLFSLLIQERLVRTSAVVARKNILLDAGLFDESLEVAEDLDMWLKIASRHRTAILNIPLSWGRRHNGSLSKNRLLHLQRLLQVLEARYDPGLVAKKLFDHRRCKLYLALGQRHLKAKNFAAANACFKEAVALSPYSLRALRYLFKVFFARRKRSVGS